MKLNAYNDKDKDLIFLACIFMIWMDCKEYFDNTIWILFLAISTRSTISTLACDPKQNNLSKMNSLMWIEIAYYLNMLVVLNWSVLSKITGHAYPKNVNTK